MKKYGKYSKKPEAKSLLLQTYFTSLLSLMLCVAMFLGTSYAWFVSEVNNSGNEIYIGTLDATLEKQTTDGKWVSLADPVEPQNGQEKVTLFDKGIRWEPGVTTMETVKITNKGDLAFKYVLSFTDGTLEKGGAKVETAGTLAEVAKNFDVWVYAHTDETVEPPKAYKDITAADSGWVKAGTLDKLLAGEPVLTGIMDQVRKTGQETNAINKNTTDGVKTEKLHTVALHMNEDATAVAMSHKISLNVKMVAYQMVSEKDSFGNGNYDELGYVSTVEGLLKAIAEAKDGDVIAVAGGTYDLTENPLKIEKSIALQALNPNDKPVLQFLVGSNQNAIEVCADNVKLKDLILSVDPLKDSAGSLVQISQKADGKYYTDIVIDGCTFTGAENCIAMCGNNVTVRGCVMDASTADNAGTLLRVWGTSGVLTVENNQFIGKTAEDCNGISFTKQTDSGTVAGQIRIVGNTFTNVLHAVAHGNDMTYTDVSVEILNNRVAGSQYEIVLVDKGSYQSYKINGNVFTAGPNNICWISNIAEADIEASGNYWGTGEPVLNDLVGDKVTVKDYYTNAEKTNLVENK